MEQNLILEQRQLLSQKMIQSLEILQMNTQELEQFLKDKALENPMLDLEEVYKTKDENSKLLKKLEWLEKTDEQNRVYYGQDHTDYEPVNFQNQTEDFGSYLLSQLIEEFKTQREQEIYEILVYSLDERGYLKEIPDILIQTYGLTKKEINCYINKLKECEPAGVGAKDLEECLHLQLQRKHMLNGLEEKILHNYLTYVAKNQLKELSKLLNLPLDQVVQTVKNIKNLNPKPAQGFSSREHLKYLYPDITIVKFKDYFEILLDGDSHFTANINSYYVEMMNQENTDEVNNYLNEKYRQAKWILQCISSRRGTLLNITKALTQRQQDFFEKGPGYLRPLKLSDVAEELGIHESTVSRGIRDKYIQCSWGIYPMSYFFSRGILSEETPDKIKSCIRKWIKNEDKKKPFSDQKIADLFKQQGIPISRRTVAKYRTQMGIRDAAGRKEYP